MKTLVKNNANLFEKFEKVKNYSKIFVFVLYKEFFEIAQKNMNFFYGNFEQSGKNPYIIPMKTFVKTNSTLLEKIEKIIELANEHKLTPVFFEKAKDYLKALSLLFRITETQAVLFCLVLYFSDDEAVPISCIARNIQCGKIELLKYMGDFECLEKKSLIRTGSNGSRFSSQSMPCYYVPMNVIKAIREGKAFRNKSYRDINPEIFFETAENIFLAYRDDEMSKVAFEAEMTSLVMNNKKLAFVQALKKHNIGMKVGLQLIAFCCLWFDEDDENISLFRLRSYIGSMETKNMEKYFNSGDHKLIKEGIITNGNDMGIADNNTWTITHKARDEFFADMDMKGKKQQNHRNLIKSGSINECPMFYPKDIDARINELVNLLGEDSFCSVKNRLAERRMTAAFTILFQGSPGTGKTETVYQIARMTGRDIFLVDISETKSQWFGESEKRIKAVFDRYKSMIKSGGLTPILLFNEADAVLGKRQELGEVRRGPAQTENAIQNIILSEMENLNGGILIATTNMAVNFDKAFERRFLYKIEFQKPDIEAKSAIWRNKLPELSKEDALVLSSRFDFSGGQIQNIARKQEISSILNGSGLSLDGLIALCENETLGKETKRIGFTSE